MNKPLFIVLFMFLGLVIFAALYDEGPDNYPITNVAVTPMGFAKDITYLCGEVRYLPDGRVRALVRYADDTRSTDSVDFPATTQIIPEDDYFIKYEIST
jgi:hypothetical protein